ncbi:MAG: NADH-quinone oxidoreductase subunit NuoE [Thermodesulfobacteriota bacterium]
MSFSLTEAARAELDRLFAGYPNRAAAILPALHVVQREKGYVPDEAIPFLAELAGTSPADVEGIATFYTMYNRGPVGRYHLQVCRNLSCSLMGAEHIIAHVSGKLGIRPGETTPDGMFTLSMAECLGSCGTAPVMMVNDEYHENLTPESIDALIERLRAGE